MSVIEDPSYEHWLQLYGDVYEALPSDRHLPCPRCGASALRLVFVGDEAERIGYAAFWCDHCRHGIHLSRVDIPSGVTVHPFGMGKEELGRLIPEYTIITPPPDTDKSGEVLAF